MSTTRRIVLFACAAVLSSGCASAPARAPEKVSCRTVYLFWPNGNHTGLLLRKEDFPVPAAVAGWLKDATTDWVDVGFGSEEHFIYVRRGQSMPKWRVLYRTPGVMMVQPFPWRGDPEDWKTSDLRYFRIDLPDREYRDLLAYIRESFVYDREGMPIIRDKLDDQTFYASTYEYSFRFVCHLWVLRGLRGAGVAGPLGWPYLQEQVQEGFVSRYKKPAVCR